MSFSTDLFCNIRFLRKTYDYLYQVQDDLEEIQRCIATCKEELLSLALMTEPNKMLFLEEGESPINNITQRVKDNLDLFEEYSVEEYKLQLLISNWDKCHDEKGFPKNLPENLYEEEAFIDGDYIKTSMTK